MSEISPPFRSGFVAIVGRPNQGKSTFINQVLGQKIAIVTHKAQTTRNRILGVLTRPECQMIFLDTPGIHNRHGSRFEQAMVQTAVNACHAVDVILYFVGMPHGLTPDDWPILQRLPHDESALFLILNKVDRMEHRNDLLPMMQQAAQGPVPFQEVVPISARTGENIDRLLERLVARLPEGVPYFPSDQITDQPERFLAAELIREALTLQVHEELPYCSAVRVDQFRVEKKRITIHAAILVQRRSQKGMVIGKRGQRLKHIGITARLALERLLGTPVRLDLWVRVEENWMADPHALRELGYWNADHDPHWG
jgi:GTP-binding protein Era